MAKKNTDHVVMLNGGGIRCLHCFAKQEMLGLWDLDVLAAAGKAFTKKHATCRRSDEVRCVFCFSPGHTSDGHVNATCLFADQWPGCGDTGMSSNAIYTHFYRVVGSRGEFAAPLDPSDFGRCHRLLATPWAADWRSRIGEMAKYPKWVNLAPAWDELEALYLLELQNANGQAPKLYGRMKELRVD